MARLELCALLAVVVASCSVEPFDFDGLGCPCPEARICACEGTAAERCVLPGEDMGCSVDAGSPDIDIVEDARSDAAVDGCDGAFRIRDLRRSWRTDDTIAIEWTVETLDEAQFDHYEVDVSDDASSRNYGPRENPELGEYQLDRSDGIVQRTLLRGLEPTTNYSIRLSAFDASGDVCSESIGSSTLATERRGSRSLYTDETPAEISSRDSILWINPDPCFELSEAAPFEGDRHLRFTIDCDRCRASGGPDSCYVNIQIGVRSNPLPSEYGLNFSDARLRFAVRVDAEGAVSSDSSLVMLRTPLQEELGENFAFRGFTLPFSPDYQLFQIPLSQFKHSVDQRPATAGELDDLFFIMFGGNWTNGSTVDLDSIEVVW